MLTLGTGVGSAIFALSAVLLAGLVGAGHFDEGFGGFVAVLLIIVAIAVAFLFVLPVFIFLIEVLIVALLVLGALMAWDPADSIPEWVWLATVSIGALLLAVALGIRTLRT